MASVEGAPAREGEEDGGAGAGTMSSPPGALQPGRERPGVHTCGAGPAPPPAGGPRAHGAAARAGGDRLEPVHKGLSEPQPPAAAAPPRSRDRQLHRDRGARGGPRCRLPRACARPGKCKPLPEPGLSSSKQPPPPLKKNKKEKCCKRGSPAARCRSAGRRGSELNCIQCIRAGRIQCIQAGREPRILRPAEMLGCALPGQRSGAAPRPDPPSSFTPGR